MKTILYPLLGLVMFALGMFFDGLITRVPKESATVANMRVMERMIRKAFAESGKVPQSLEEMIGLYPELKERHRNAWGNAITYMVTNQTDVVMTTVGYGDVEFVRRFNLLGN